MVFADEMSIWIRWNTEGSVTGILESVDTKTRSLPPNPINLSLNCLRNTDASIRLHPRYHRFSRHDFSDSPMRQTGVDSQTNTQQNCRRLSARELR